MTAPVMPRFPASGTGAASCLTRGTETPQATTYPTRNPNRIPETRNRHCSRVMTGPSSEGRTVAHGSGRIKDARRVAGGTPQRPRRSCNRGPASLSYARDAGAPPPRPPARRAPFLRVPSRLDPRRERDPRRAVRSDGRAAVRPRSVHAGGAARSHPSDAPRPGPSVRDRRDGTRSRVARAVRRPAVAGGGGRGAGDRAGARARHRRGRGLARRRRRRRRDARRRSAAGAAGSPRGARGRGRRAGAGERAASAPPPGSVGGAGAAGAGRTGLGRDREARARRDRAAARRSVHRRRARRRRGSSAHRRPAPAAERPRSDRRRGHPRPRREHPDGSLAVVPRRRRAPADPVVGDDDRRSADSLPRPPLGGARPRARHPHGGARLQPARRRAARSPRSEIRERDRMTLSAARRPARSSGRRLARLVLHGALAALPLLAWGCAERQDAAPAAAPQVFRFRLREEPPTLDPALMTDNLSESIIMNVNRGLVAMDPATLAVTPAVASSWTVSPDGLTYTFRLRDDAFFHNGRAVAAADVVWSFERLLRKETHSPRRWLLEPIRGAGDFAEGKAATVAGLAAPDPHTVVLTLDRPFAPFLGMLTMGGASIVPREVYEDAEKKYLRAPVGCGPFRVARVEPSSLIELQAFDRYYGGPPALDTVQARIIENQVTALQEYRTGGLDSLDEVPIDLPAEIRPEVLRYPLIGVGYIGFNLDRPPFKGNAALRQAFNYAVDKDYLWGTLMPGANTPARGIIPPGIPGYDPDLPGYPRDEAKARALLARAGYPSGQGLPPIALWFNTSGDNRRIAEQVQADLRKIGVTLTLREVDWGAYLKAVEGTPQVPG